MSTTIETFQLSIAQDLLNELQQRLTLTRWPDRETVGDTSQGPQLAKVQALCERWRAGYDWRNCEAFLNAAGQFRTVIDGLRIHFLHIKSPDPTAVPLLLCHGWPGSILEFRKVIGPLSAPAEHGALGSPAFHLVIPSMPGFGFSDKPTEPGWGIDRVANAWIALMERLGYTSWGAQGGDLGTAVIDSIAAKRLKALLGIHLNFVMFRPTPEEMEQATPAERAMMESENRFWELLSGYAKEQATRPQTIGYSLADSPVGLAAWIYSMFQDTSGTPGNAEATFEIDEMLDDIMMYWLPNAGTSSARMYWEMTNTQWRPAVQPSNPITVPSGFSMFPKEHVRKSRRLIEKRYTNMVYFHEPDAGGHFAALEQPEVLIHDVRQTFSRILRRSA